MRYSSSHEREVMQSRKEKLIDHEQYIFRPTTCAGDHRVAVGPGSRFRGAQFDADD